MSEKRNAIVAALEEAGVGGGIWFPEAYEARAAGGAIAEGGVRAVEVTMTVPGAVDLIRGLAPTLPAGFLLGAGTVLDADTARRVIDAGAAVVVRPAFRRAVIAACHEREGPAL